MRYYQYHIGDFNNATRYASRLERSIYRDLLDMYYEQESAIDGTDLTKLERRLNVRSTDEQTALNFVLTEYFENQEGFYFNNRCEFEIKKYQEKLDSAIKAGKASAEARRKKSAKKQRKGTEVVDVQDNSTSVEQPLNESSTDVQPTNKPIEPNNQSTNTKESDSLVDFWNDNRPSNSQVKVSVWSKKIKTRLKTFTADEIKQAMLFVINDNWYQSNNQVLIKNVIDSDDRCAAVLEKSNQPAKVNYQGNRHAQNQPINTQSQPKQSSADVYAADIARQLREHDATHQ